MNHLNTINNQRSRQRGTTLIELSVVIAVLLLLVGVLFIGITAWRNGANKAACIVNLSSIQKAARGYQNLNALNTGNAETVANLQAAGFWSVTPTCPAPGGVYAMLGTVPAPGAPYCVCSLAGALGHAPTPGNLANW